MNTEPRRSRAVKKDPAVAKKPAVRRKSPAKKPLAETETEVASVTTPPPVPQQEEMAVEQTTPPIIAEPPPKVEEIIQEFVPLPPKASRRGALIGTLVFSMVLLVIALGTFFTKKESCPPEVLTVEIEYVMTPYESFTLLPDTVVQIDNHLEVELPAEQEPSLDLLHEFTNGDRLILNSGEKTLTFKIKQKE